MTRPASQATAAGGSASDSASEHERIKAAYRYYDSSGAIQRKRDDSNPGNRLNGANRWRALQRVLQGLALPEGFQLLDVGCGVGQDLHRIARGFAQLRPSLHGIDLLPDRVERAREAVPAAVFHVGGAERLPYRSGMFDVITAATVFSSILDGGVAGAVAREMTRVLAPTGTIICYDMRYPNPWNPHIRAMRARDWRRLFPGARLRLTSLTLLPQLARRLGVIAPPVCRRLSVVRVLHSHYLVEIQPQPAQPPRSGLPSA